MDTSHKQFKDRSWLSVTVKEEMDRRNPELDILKAVKSLFN